MSKLTVGQKLKKLRESFQTTCVGITQEQLSALTGLSKQRIHLWETDQRGMTLDAAKKIAKALDCKVSDLVD